MREGERAFPRLRVLKQNLVAKIMQTPKAVVDEREKAYQKQHPKRGPKPT